MDGHMGPAIKSVCSLHDFLYYFLFAAPFTYTFIVMNGGKIIVLSAEAVRQQSKEPIYHSKER